MLNRYHEYNRQSLRTHLGKFADALLDTQPIGLEVHITQMWVDDKNEPLVTDNPPPPPKRAWLNLENISHIENCEPLSPIDDGRRAEVHLINGKILYITETVEQFNLPALPRRRSLWDAIWWPRR